MRSCRRHSVSSRLACAVAVGLPIWTTAQTVLPATVSVPWGPAETLYGSHTFVMPETSGAFRVAFSGPYSTDTVQGLKTWKMWYQVLDPTTGAMDTIRPLIQSGVGYSQTHPISPVYIEPPTRQNSFFPSASEPTSLSNGQVLVPFGYWKLIGNTLEHVNDSFTFTRAGVLIGTWNTAHSDLSWSVGLTNGLDYSTQSTRGEIEPSVVELDQPGRVLMSIRGANEGNLSLPGRAWKAVSNDYGQTWSATSELKYSDGTAFYSPSAMSTVIRNHANNKVYWLGNIVGSNPNGDSPRYPLVIGEMDQKNLAIVKGSVQTIAGRDPATQSTALQYSNFSVTESPLTGQFTVNVPVYDYGVETPTFFVSNLPITKTAPTPVDDSTPWKLRYEGNVSPTQAGAIQFSTGTASQFFTRYGDPSTGTDGSVLHLSTPMSGAAVLGVDTKIPFNTGATLKLNPTVGYTVEFRAKLNSITGTGQMTGGATVQIPNGVTGGNALSISLIDPNGSAAGKAVAWSGATTQTAYSIPDGFNTYRLTVKDTVAKLYVDGILLGTDVSGGATGVTYEMRIGDFTDSAGANWDLDYFRVYDLGAVAPITPPSTWITNASDNWNASANWTSVSPNGVDAVANFLGAISAARTVVADTPVTVGTLKFDNANGYQIAGQGSLTIDVSTGAGSIDVVQGSHKINLPLFINDNTTANVAAGATLKISDPMTLVGGVTLTKTGTGTLSIEAPVSNVAPATLAAAAGVTGLQADMGQNTSVSVSGGVVSIAASQHLASIDVTGGAVAIVPGAHVVVTISSLSLIGDGQIDLADGKLLVNYGGASPMPAILDWLAAGNITSSQLVPGRAIGFGEASDLFSSFPAVFAGELIDNTTVLLAYTVPGDVSLDGIVDSTDFNLLAAHYGQLAGARWTQGDLDSDGKVTTSDFNQLAGHFGDIVTPGAALGSVIPEPAMLSCAAMTALGIGRLGSRRCIRKTG